MKLSDLPKHVQDQIRPQLADGPQPPSASVAVMAKGKPPVGREMNKLEAQFARHLDLKLLTGEISGYLYEAIKLRLADRTWDTPHFCVFSRDGSIEFYGTKGFMRDDAAVKLKVAAEQYPRFGFCLVTRSKGQWIFTPIGRR